MFSLVCGLYSFLTEKPEYKILMVGLDESGKTTFLEQVKSIYRPSYRPMKYPKYIPTIGLNIGRFETPAKKILLWDLGGQRNLRSIWTKYYTDADALIFVIDLASSDQRLQEAKEAFEQATNGIHPSCPILVVANRSDLVESQQIESVSDLFHMDKLLATEPSPDAKSCKFFPTSSLTGEGIETAIKWLVESL